MLKIQFQKSALINIGQIKLYYNSQKEKLGDKFIDEIILDLQKLKQFPKLGSKYQENIRKLVFKRNYNIYYFVTEKEIKIIKIINTKIDL